MREQKEFDTLFRQYYSPLLIYALQYIDDIDDANDVVSTAYEDLWKNFTDIDAITVKSFLYVSVKNLCIDMLRRRKCHERYVKFVATVSDTSMNANADIDASYKESVVKALFDKLNPPTSDILKACYIDGKRYKQVAEEMDISVSTVKKHIIKALKLIREIRKNIE